MTSPLRLGTRGSAAVLKRDDLGSLEPGKSADLAIWRTDGLELAGAQDPVAMAEAMKLAVRSGRLAFLAGRISRKMYATASSPVEGLVGR